jgi:hypothetical protein
MPDRVMVRITILHDDGTQDSWLGEADSFTLEQHRDIQPIYDIGNPNVSHFVPGMSRRTFQVQGQIFGQEGYQPANPKKPLWDAITYNRFDLEE